MLPSPIRRMAPTILVLIAMISFIPVCVGEGRPARAMEKNTAAAYLKDSQYAVEDQVIAGETG